jgi:Uncharacterized protein containing LysM domain
MNNNQVLVKSTIGAFQVTALLGQTPAQITEGFGGWSVVDRPRRTGMTQWKGKTPFQMTLPLMLDGWIDAISQESNIRQLIWMSLPNKNGDPAPINVYGALPFPSGGKWVINALEWGDSVIWSTDAKPVRLRQDVTLTLIQFVAPDQVELLNSNTGLAPVFKGPYTVKAGDNLRSIAMHFYGDYNQWQKIADANGLRDSKIPKSKKTLIIPPIK